jgi:hypothetical protein
VAGSGAIGVAAQIDAPAAVPIDAAQSLMQAEAACVAGPAPCPAVALPDALANQ